VTACSATWTGTAERHSAECFRLSTDRSSLAHFCVLDLARPLVMTD